MSGPHRGSSPLARGLPGGGGAPHRPGRIIPARAGFTNDLLDPEQQFSGSSPLARGLLLGLSDNVSYFGIIPARAGFTAMKTPIIERVGDHPRSRGVYPCIDVQIPKEIGSSPLARGLLLLVIRAEKWAGIIPARAGFTTWEGLRRLANEDHPRSRGVYRAYGSEAGVDIGSSPLARGLRRAQHAQESGMRIIPARAGFTQLGLVDACLMRDHPRSRGVYSRSCRCLPWGRGSSPLARGLRLRGCSSITVGRIIPARAGFTWRTSPIPSGIWDHPRSRGVYWPGPPWARATRGSSPLARGLHSSGAP